MKKNIKVFGLLAVLIIGMSTAVVKNDKLFEITKNIEIFANIFFHAIG
jgi:hypothetical protein